LLTRTGAPHRGHLSSSLNVSADRRIRFRMAAANESVGRSLQNAAGHLKFAGCAADGHNAATTADTKCIIAINCPP
jgi:hypothetical protein